MSYNNKRKKSKNTDLDDIYNDRKNLKAIDDIYNDKKNLQAFQAKSSMALHKSKMLEGHHPKMK